MDSNEINKQRNCPIKQATLNVIIVCILTVFCGLLINFITQPYSRSLTKQKNNLVERNQYFGTKTLFAANKEAWILYYASYANIQNDDHWGSWRFRRYEYDRHNHEPPTEYPSIYYPQLGIYSSHNESIILLHFQMLKSLNVDALIVPWFGPSHHDIQYQDDVVGFTDSSMKILMKHAKNYNLKIIPLIPNYEKRNLSIVESDLRYYFNMYSGDNSSYHTQDHKLLAYIYDIHNFDEGADVINGLSSLYNFVASGLTYQHFLDSYDDGAIGYITYFATERFSWSATAENWPKLSSACIQRNMMFIPTVAPGYNDSQIDRWNSKQCVGRNCTNFYDQRWREALEVNPEIILINSFNGWREGTNIEPPISQTNFTLDMSNWCGNKPNHYLDSTKKWIETFKKK